MLNITKILQGTPTDANDISKTLALNITKILQGTPTSSGYSGNSIG